MKYLVLFTMLLCACCKVDNGTSDDLPLDQSQLTGQWELEATKISPGGPVEWTADRSGITYSFNADGTFTYVVPENIEYNKSGAFSLNGPELRLNYTRDSREFNDRYFMELDSGKLILQFIGCIEECKERYNRK